VAAVDAMGHAASMEAQSDAANLDLDQDECWRLLSTAEVGRLAVSIANHPDIFPVNFVVDERTIVFRSDEGTKLAAAVLTPSVAFEIDGVDGGRAWSVVVVGRAREIEKMDDLYAALELPLHPWQRAPKHRYVRLVPDRVSGRRFEIAGAAGG
jgi:nitroimidazol reductase NimA-like FMN-containing flavoprotein (pyridoxamine 5'-phosphate oxidase superfamily)